MTGSVNETNENGNLDQLATVGETAAHHTPFAVIDERKPTAHSIRSPSLS